MRGKRIKMRSRVISFVMAIAMVLTLVTVAPVTAQAAGVTNITIHFKNDWGWVTPAIQYWGGTAPEVTGGGETKEVPGWDGAEATMLTADEDGIWYTITLKGDFEGFQLLDFSNPKNTVNNGLRVLAMNYCDKDTPTNIYCGGDTLNNKDNQWFLDDTFQTSIKTLIPEDVEEVVAPATLTGDFTGITFTDPAAGIENWTPADSNADLYYVGDGVYARTFTFKPLEKETTIQYKVAFEHGWDHGEIGDGSDNISLTLPEGETSFTVVCDKENRKVLTSLKSEETDKVISLIGTIRNMGDDVNWTPGIESTEFDFHKFSENVYIYQRQIPQGSSQYKVVGDHKDWIVGGDNKVLDITAADGKVVTFVYDVEANDVYDSVNNLDTIKELLTGKAPEGPAVDEAKSNANGTTTFTAVAEKANKVELVYGNKEEVATKGDAVLKTVTMTQSEKDASVFTTSDLFFGDEALDIVYYYVVDGTKKAFGEDATTVKVGENTYLSYTREKFEGRKVCIPGTFPGKSWDVTSNEMEYKGEGLYTYTFKDVPAANYEYKISMGSWSENYGDKGVKDGANIAVTVPETQDVTIYYSDLSHFSRCSINYQYGADIKLEGTGIPEDTKFSDSRLTGVYSATVAEMEVGTYSDTKIVPKDGDKIALDSYKVETKKDVTFYYDPESGVYYSNASDAKVDESLVVYDSKDTNYKNVFGAVATGKDVTYSIDTGKDVTSVHFIVKGVAKKNLAMTKVDGAAEGQQRWSVTTSYDKLGEYNYFFAVYNGTAAIMYGDDDAYYGKGTTSDLLNMLPYDQIVYQDGYKTPDWMKNAVVYQIFPERFYNGDASNDTANTNARGDVDYELINDWYTLPENPEQETLHPDTYPANAYKGDGNWSNEIYGGDLKGITERIDYLKALGVSVIYLNPVFESISSHRYDTSDYKNIDPILGTLGDFEELVNVAKENGMRVVLDGVFNHVSDDSVYFDRYYEYLEKGTDTIGAYPYWAYVYDTMSEKGVSKEEAETLAKDYFTKNYGITNYDYTEWFDVFTTTLKDDNDEEVCDKNGLRAGKPVYGYDGWWGYDSMPIIKATDGSEYQTGTWAQEVIGKNETSTTADDSVTQYWLSKGMSGWRLDVANEVSDETWQHFRKSVKALDSDNVIIGEIWTDAVKYLMGDMYDSVMNYMFRGAAIAYAKGGSSTEAMNTLERLRERYPQEAFYAMMNLVDSHDTTRLLSYLDGIDDDRNQKEIDQAFPSYENTSEAAKQKQYLVALMQFTYAGAPTVYYGDELGMVGADDPDDRRAMIWGEGNEKLVKWYAKLAAIRNNYPALRTGTVEPVSGTDTEILSYVRSDKDDKMLVIMNNAATEKEVTINAANVGMKASELSDLITGTKISVTDGTIKVTVPAYNGVILTDSAKVKEVTVNEDALKPGFDPSYKIPVRSTGDTTGGNTSGTVSSDDTTTVTNPDGSKTETTVIKNLPADTKASLNVTTDAKGNKTSEASVETKGTEKKSGVSTSVSADVVKAITDKAKTTDVTIKQEVKKADGSTAYTVEVSAGDVKAGENLKLLKKDAKTGELVLVNKKDYTVSADGSVDLTIKNSGEYVLLSQKDANKEISRIKKTVKATKTSVTVKKKKTTKFPWSKKLNMENVDKIVYTSSKKSVVTVNKNGKITAKKKGTAKVKAVVTLKNGTKKTVTMKVKVK